MAADGRIDGPEPSAKRVSLDNYAVAAGPRLGWRGWLRWIWRQVTSMRVALILLLLLALAAIPGSVIPQRPQDAAAARAFIEEYPTWGAWLDRLGFLDVFGSAWFTAIYLLLFASLIGCIIPRSIAHYRTLRAPISAAPRSLARYEHSRQVSVDDGDAAIARAVTTLRPREGAWGALTGSRTRVDKRTVDGVDQIALAADKGHVREVGNLVFHIALIGILLSMVLGSLVTYRGQAIVVEGRAFTNALVAYDAFEAGRLFDPASLDPFTLRLDQLDSEFELSGLPISFTANVTLHEPGRAARSAQIEVNRPLQVDGGKIYLQGNGYAPDLTVIDSDGNVAHAGPVPFLPQDAAYTSEGVVKVPDVTSGPQIGLKGTLLPSAFVDETSAVSLHPDPVNPLIIFTVYTGDLGLDEGVPQNAYVLDESQLSPVQNDTGELRYFAIEPGQTVELPDGLGTVTWEGLPRFVALDLRTDPTLPWLLGFAMLMLVALGMSLFGSRRRVWMLAVAQGPTTVVTVAIYAPGHDEGIEAQLDTVVAALMKESE